MVLLMRGLMAAYLLFALLATATPIGRINSPIVRNVHVPEMAKLIPRAPPPEKRRPVSPLPGSDAKKQSTGPDPSDPPEIPEIPRLANHDDFAYAERRLLMIRSQSAVGQVSKYAYVRPKVVKWINDLARDIPQLPQGTGKDEEAKLQQHMLLNFLEVREYVAAWGLSEAKTKANSALNCWKEAMFPKCPKRAATDTDVSYITRQLLWIQDGLTVYVLKEEAQLKMATYLSILFEDIERLLSRDIKALFPGLQTLSLDMRSKALDVEAMLPNQQQLSSESRERVKGLGEMLALAFTVLWNAKLKVAGWTPSKAKALSRSAIMDLESALDKVKNDQKVDLVDLRKLLKSVEKSHPGYMFELERLVVGLTRARITELMTMQGELDLAYKSRTTKVGVEYLGHNERQMKQWMELDSLGQDEPYKSDQ